MTSTPAEPEVQLTPPGPGSWELDVVHFPRTATAYWAAMHPEPFTLGYRDTAAYYGLPLQTRLVAYPGNFAYGQMVPLPAEAFDARVRRAAEVFERKLWREHAREWEQVRKPASERANREIQAVDVDALDDAELIAYLRRCCDHHAQMCRQHIEFTVTAALTPGDFLAHVREWTDVPTLQLVGLLSGASPVSGGASPQRTALLDAFAADDAARAELDADDVPGSLLQRLRSQPSAAGRALDEYLAFVGHRLLDGFDISGPYALELPDVLLRSIRTTVTDGVSGEVDAAALAAEVRAKVPPANREQFDELLAEARVGFRVRDERGIFGDVWAAGLMRRAALAAGRRLVERGRVHDPTHLVFANVDEMCALLDGASSPTAGELAARAEFYRTHTAKDAPPHLGDDPPPRPDPSTFPPPMRRLMTAMATAMGEVFGSSEQEHETTVIRGLAASGGVREGLVRRVTGPGDFDRIQQGDVLLTEATTEAFNVLLPLLSAIITDNGGALSHAAIVAREYGIPGVVGTRDGTTRIPEGARVLVDGNAGVVTVLGWAS